MTILFAAGGTGGHVYPAIAIAEEIKKIRPDARIVFVGTKKKIESRIVPEKGFEFRTLWISGFSRKMTVSNILFPVKVIVSLVQSFFVIRKIRPNAVVGTGGYVCGPILFTAAELGIPAMVHESNSYPGVTTRMVASRVAKVFITFEITKKWLSPKASVEILGNPTREELSVPLRLQGSSYFNLDPAKKTLFVFGGSLGAASINKVMPKIVDDAVANDYQVIWQTGESDWEAAKTVQPHRNIAVMKYIDRMDFGYAACDVVVSRSGATTLAELTRLGKPAVLVPYPYAAANHQEMNAQTMVDAGAAVMVKDSELNEKLLPAVRELLSNDSMSLEMKKKSITLGNPDAGRNIALRILSLAR